MGCINDTAKKQDDPVQNQTANNNDSEEIDEKAYKLLLLGAGGSGKSTVFRQVKILYGGGYDEDERLTLAVTIHQNMVQSIKMIVKQALRNVEKSNSLDPGIVAEINSLPDDGPFKDVQKIGQLIVGLWNNEQLIKDTYNLRSRYQLPTDTVHYFFNKAESIMRHDYIPTQEDLLHCRVLSTGVKTETFDMGEGLQFRLLDVGGQRSERKKWVRCFENVTAVLYVVAISEYDQLCYEDNETNRVLEALDLFEDIANSEWFADIDIVLFLNKKDLLAEKIKSIPPQDFFPQFKGDGSYDSVLNFLKTQFNLRNQQEREVITHVTCATDTSNISDVFEQKVKAILRNKQNSKMMM